MGSIKCFTFLCNICIRNTYPNKITFFLWTDDEYKKHMVAPAGTREELQVRVWHIHNPDMGLASAVLQFIVYHHLPHFLPLILSTTNSHLQY